MELYQIRYVLAVAETRNFTRAAERVFVSQPALTKAIQRLEETLGGRLFERSRVPLALTAFGEGLMPHFERIQAEAAQARLLSRTLADQRRQQVRLGVMCSIHLPSVLPGLARCMDDALGLRFRDGSQEALCDALDRGEADLALLSAPEPLPRRFEAHPLYDEDFVLAIGEDHRFFGREQVAAAELDREHYCERLGCEFTSHIERLLQQRGVQMQTVQQTLREDWIQAFVRAGLGVSFMPRSLARAAALPFVHVQSLPIVRQVQLVRNAEATPTAAEQAVLQAMTGHAWQV
jgi:LysR family transcriptional regulator, hydrogen peroxide-inducible genes activator